MSHLENRRKYESEGLKDAKEYINDYIKQEIDSGNFDTFRAYN